MDFDIKKEQELLYECLGDRKICNGVSGIDILSNKKQLFRGNIQIARDGSFKGYGQGIGRREDPIRDRREEFLIGCYAMNAKTEKIGYAFYRLNNGIREEYDEPQIIISVGSFRILDLACEDGVYRKVKPTRRFGILHSSGYSYWPDPTPEFDEHLNLELGSNWIYAEKGIEFCRRIVREL